jgi:hypothetical protein
LNSYKLFAKINYNLKTMENNNPNAKGNNYAKDPSYSQNGGQMAKPTFSHGANPFNPNSQPSPYQPSTNNQNSFPEIQTINRPQNVGQQPVQRTTQAG